ncbi:hypothetical protein [Aureimonas leprariae]|uniref:hypothetical protein n=1 Tax=Plantimonas leprariae TaxID=2615207 RepID=UPI001386DC7B|nr:hypothetical protein [Aureimonas leprariae]
MAPLAACNIIPPEGPSLIAQRPNRDFGPSSQRQDKNGYPLLGAFPGAAAKQLDPNAVAQDRAGMLAAANQQNNEVRSASAEYQQSVAEAQAIRAQHQQDVQAITSTQSRSDSARKSNEDVIRQIEQGSTTSSGQTTPPSDSGR